MDATQQDGEGTVVPARMPANASSRADLQLLTAEDVAGLLQVDLDWLYRAYRRGDIIGCKLGRRTLRFRPADVATFLQELSTAPIDRPERR